MKDFTVGWQAVDQTVGVIALIAALAMFIAWVLFGEHKYGGHR